MALLQQSNVEAVCTTDDPIDDLAHHALIAHSALKTRVLPTFRPDQAMRFNHAGFLDYLLKLGAAAGMAVDSFSSLIAALTNRVHYFAGHGARMSDHSLELELPTVSLGETRLEALFQQRRTGSLLSDAEVAQLQLAPVAATGARLRC